MNCVFTADCYWVLDAILEYTAIGRVPSVFIQEESRKKTSSNNPLVNSEDLPRRMDGSHLSRHSKVLASDQELRYWPLPSCPVTSFAVTEPLNETAPA